MLKLEYVVSAIGMAGPLNSNLLKSQHFETEVVPAIRGAVDILKQKVKASAKNVDPSVAVLFNAYTEKKFVDHMKDYNKFNMEGVYADSGGLQMVTTGKAVTPQIKDDI